VRQSIDTTGRGAAPWIFVDSAWWNNGRLVFDHRDPEPYTSGHFAFRTVTSHFRISDFTVWRPPARG